MHNDIVLDYENAMRQQMEKPEQNWNSVFDQTA